MEDLIPFDPQFHSEMSKDTCVENFSGAALKVLAASNTKCRPRDDSTIPIPAGIKDETRMKNRLWRLYPYIRDRSGTALILSFH